MNINVSQIEKQVCEIAVEVGGFIHGESLVFDASRLEQKQVFNNLVSYVDKESEKRLVTALDKILPGAGILAEEGTSRTSSNEYQWIIDPLDGTTNFAHGFPPFAISIGLARNHEVILGVIYEVSRKECFHASLDGQACCNGKPIRVTPISDLNKSLLATGFPYYHFEMMGPYLEIIKEFLDKSHGVRRLGSAATDLAYVACGRLEGFFEYNLSSWDVAAGSFLVQQAGGIVTDFSGRGNFLHGGELCAAGPVHPQMLEVIKRIWGYS